MRIHFVSKLLTVTPVSRIAASVRTLCVRKAAFFNPQRGKPYVFIFQVGFPYYDSCVRGMGIAIGSWRRRSSVRVMCVRKILSLLCDKECGY